MPTQPLCCWRSYAAALCHTNALASLELAGDCLCCALLHSANLSSGSNAAYSRFLISANPVITTLPIVTEQAVRIRSAYVSSQFTPWHSQLYQTLVKTEQQNILEKKEI